MKYEDEAICVNDRKLVKLFVFILMLWLLALPALSEQARIVTPGGALNMRKNADEKSKLVDTVPNRSMVEVEEVGDVWSKITYKKKTGYVKTEFLKLPANIIGKTVYADQETFLRVSPDAKSAVLYPISGFEPVTVDRIEGDWACVQCAGREGYVETAAFSYQLDVPSGGITWIPESVMVLNDCELKAEPKAKAQTIGQLKAGETVTGTLISKDYCLVLTDDDQCGYALCASLVLIGPEDTEISSDDQAAMAEAVSRAEAALKKQYKGYAKERLYSIVNRWNDAENTEDTVYKCGFFNDQDQYRYCALVSVNSSEILYTGCYDQFAAPQKRLSLLPDGTVKVTLSADSLKTGEVLDITVQAWTEMQCAYSLSLNGKTIVESEPGGHFTASYRPRAEGEYTLIVTVRDEAGKTVSQQADFSVMGDGVSDGLCELYSQKDGWWADKKYRHSNLGKSGCAIFTLSHALQRMGITDQSVLPENLAVKYAYCLIPGEGTSNELLINTAARDYGFKTRTKLYNDKKQIMELIGQGAFFSFSPARGHIALVVGVSADGSMVRVADSAPHATFERIVNAAQYYQMRSGAFRAALTLDDIPGSRWFFETNDYGALEYYLPMDYVAKRGVRLIQPIAE